MERFLHQSTRLNIDTDRTWRYFRQPDHMMRWLALQITESKAPDGLLLEGYNDSITTWQWTVSGGNKRKLLIYTIPDVLSGNLERTFSLEIHIMMAASRTEYCTDVHLLQKGFEDSEEDHGLRALYNSFWTEKLEVLRQRINGDWVISDADLTRSSLM